MATFSAKCKHFFLRVMEIVGTSASNLADNAKLKVTEMNLETRRREILNDFCMRAYDLWQKGEHLPEPLEGMLKELSGLDEKLNLLHAQKYAPVDPPVKLHEDATQAPFLPQDEDVQHDDDMTPQA